MQITTFFFWLSLGILFYCYLGYGMLAALLTFFKTFFLRKKEWDIQELQPVTLIVSAYNEEDNIEQKISNILSLDYPRELLQVIFVTDGSIDRSVDMIRPYSFITLLHEPERKGKYAAIKRAMQKVTTPFVVFSDANTILNKESIRRMVFHYADPRIGAVAGEKKILSGPPFTAVGTAEGLYWQYESFMKQLDAGLFTVVGAAGELFSIRTELFVPLSDELVLDDFIISMQVCLSGYRIEYEPGAFATEMPSASFAEEEKRKVRIAAGAYQSIRHLKSAMNIFRHPLLSLQFISRRLFRWIFGPLMLFVLLISNILIIRGSSHPFIYDLLFWLQLLFYTMAFFGALLVRSGKPAGIFTIPFYFIFMNFCLAKGFARFLRGDQTVLWEKSLRQAVE